MLHAALLNQPHVARRRPAIYRFTIPPAARKMLFICCNKLVERHGMRMSNPHEQMMRER
jgi:hypothetical protein